MLGKSTEFLCKNNMILISCVHLDTLQKYLVTYIKYLLCAKDYATSIMVPLDCIDPDFFKFG